MKSTCYQFIRKAGRIVGAALAILAAQALCTGQTVVPSATALGAFSQPLRGPVRVGTDAAGRIYVSDRTAGQVLVFDAFGRPVSVKTGVTTPLAIAVDSNGRIYVAQERRGSVSVFDAQWNLLFQLGQGDGEFALPSHIALDAATGNACVCDSGANQIKLYHNSQPVSAFGGYGSGPGQFDFPSGVWVSPAGEVFVVDQNNNRVQVFDRAGVFQRQFSLDASGSGAGLSGRSQGITGDNSGRIYVADGYQGRVQVFDAQGNFLSAIGRYGDKAGQFRLPVSLAVDAYGRLLAASASNRRIEIIGLDRFIHFAATPASQLVATGTRATFSVFIAGAGPFTYQWRKGTNNLIDTPNILGATQATLTLTSATTADTGAYSVTVTDPSGTFTSPEAVLTVVTPPTLLSQPASQTVPAGTPALFTVSALGEDLVYQWQLNGVVIAGATTPALSIPAAQTADVGRYTVVITNLVGAVASDPALLTVFAQPVPPQLDPVSFLPDGSLRIFFYAEAGFNYAVEFSSDLAAWQTLATVFSADGTVEYFDPDAAVSSQRFYRVRWAP